MAGDIYYNNVSLLLHCDGTNGSTTFTDNSPSPKTVTANGNAQISTAQSVFGGASALFDGTGDWLSIPMTSADMDLGGGDWTIEFWYYPITAVLSDRVFQSRDGDVIAGLYLSHSNSTQIAFNWSSNGTSFQGSGITFSVTQNVWQHVAITRSGDTATAWVEGASSGTLAITGAMFYSTSHTFIIGGQSTPERTPNAYIDEFRITKGVARYTSAFTAPTAPFGNAAWYSIGQIVSAKGTILGENTIPQTGMDITISEGTSTPSYVYDATGYSISTASGTAGPDNSIPQTGLQITSQQGTFAEVLNGIFLALTGQSSTLAYGTATPSLASVLSGFSVSAFSGTLSPFVEVLVALTGLEFAAVEGALGNLITRILTGATLTAGRGSFTPTKGFALTGKQLTLSKGLPKHRVQIGATGYELTFSEGQLNYTVPLSSQSIVASKGAINAIHDKALSGSTIQVDGGALISAMSQMVSGQSISVSRGDTSVSISKTVTGNSIILAGKGDLVFDSRDVSINLSGKQIDTAQGEIYIGADQWYNFTRVLAGGNEVTVIHLA